MDSGHIVRLWKQQQPEKSRYFWRFLKLSRVLSCKHLHPRLTRTTELWIYHEKEDILGMVSRAPSQLIGTLKDMQLFFLGGEESRLFLWAWCHPFSRSAWHCVGQGCCALSCCLETGYILWHHKVRYECHILKFIHSLLLTGFQGWQATMIYLFLLTLKMPLPSSRAEQCIYISYSTLYLEWGDLFFSPLSWSSKDAWNSIPVVASLQDDP